MGRNYSQVLLAVKLYCAADSIENKPFHNITPKHLFTKTTFTVTIYNRVKLFVALSVSRCFLIQLYQTY